MIFRYASLNKVTTLCGDFEYAIYSSSCVGMRQTNAPRCRRGSCTQCTTYRLKRARLKVEENEAERQRELRILASLGRNTKRKWVVLDDL